MLSIQDYRSCKCQGSISKTSLQINMQNFVSTKSDLLATNKKQTNKQKQKSNNNNNNKNQTNKQKQTNIFHQNLIYKVLSFQRWYILYWFVLYNITQGS